MMVCKKCKKVKIDNKWIPSTNLRRKVTFTLCIDCSKSLKQNVQGVLLIDSEFFAANDVQAVTLIKAEEKRSRDKNIFSRIVEIQKGTAPVTIKTTDSQLAIQIGKQFKRQFKGELAISKNPKTGVTVRWSAVPETATPVKAAV